MRVLGRQVGLLAWAVALMLGGPGLCATGPHDAFLSGPWEVMVRVGLEGDTLHFPIHVTHENKAQALDQLLPVRKTPVTINFRHYVPDLGWEVQCFDRADGGHVAQLSLEGPDLKQAVWLDSADLKKRAVSSEIGGVEIKAWQNRQTSESLFQAIVMPDVVGVLSAWDTPSSVPVEAGVMSGSVITLKPSQTQLTVLKYVPHYSVDKDTKAVAGSGTEPVNPAILVRAEIGGQTYERWVWSRFDDPPHQTIDFPVRVSFACTQLGSRPEGKYQLLTISGCEPKMLYASQNGLVLNDVTPKTRFSFANPDYGVVVNQVRCGASIKTVWRNRSDRLIRPALVATFRSQFIEQEVVLEFNKPYHYKTGSGTLVLVYRRMGGSARPGQAKS
ncbi:MAG: hypothetical protein GY809_29160 [Planctomycetes bacterium]|nr:hypothetical protein [Planctomycetota bacterium]